MTGSFSSVAGRAVTALASAFFLAGTLSAQEAPAVKIGFVDLKAVIDGYSKTADLEAAIEKDKAAWKTAIDARKSKIARMRTDLEALPPGSAERAQISGEIAKVEAVVKVDEEQLEQRLQTALLKATQEVYADICRHCESIRKQEGYLALVKVEGPSLAGAGSKSELILRLNSRSVLAWDPSADVTRKVMDSLNKEHGQKGSTKAGSPRDGWVVGASAKLNLVIISLGEQDGLKPGMRFEVSRDGVSIGTVVVEELYPRQASCRPADEATGRKVQPGDRVVRAEGVEPGPEKEPFAPAPSLQRLVERLASGHHGERREAQEALAKIGRPAVPLLLPLLRHPERDVRGAAIDVLAEIEDETAVDPLIEVLWKDENDWVRSRAARALGRSAYPRALEHLLKALEDDRPGVRSSAAAGLSRFKDPRTLPALVRALRDSDGDVRVWAMSSISFLADRTVLDPVIQALTDQEEHVRRSAARVLGRLQDRKAVGPLIETLNDPDPEVREEALEALRKLTGESFSTYEAWKRWFQDRGK